MTMNSRNYMKLQRYKEMNGKIEKEKRTTKGYKLN